MFQFYEDDISYVSVVLALTDGYTWLGENFTLCVIVLPRYTVHKNLKVDFNPITNHSGVFLMKAAANHLHWKTQDN